MRNAFLLLAAVVSGCASDVIDVATHAPVPNALVLQPKSKVLDTAATFQFDAKASWSDGTDRPVSVVYSTTGGEITTAGLYKASSTPGSFLVVATCVCGLADTATVIVSTTPVLTASLVLSPATSTMDTGSTQQYNAVVIGPDSMTPATKVIFTATGGTISPTGLFRAGALPGIFFVIATCTNCRGSDSAKVTVKDTPTPTSALPPHPRVWMTPTRVASLRTQAANNTVRWQRVKAAADAQLAPGATYDASQVPELCLSYLGTGDVRYAQRAGLILTIFATEAVDLTRDWGYSYRFEVPLVTMGLDWCYDGLTVAQRQQSATWLMNRADWVWPESNPPRAGDWAVNSVENNYYWGFMMSGPAALAADGDDTGVGAKSGSNRPAYHRQLALTKWNSVAVPFFEGEGAGGAWAEGTNYDSSWRVGSFADAYFTSGVPLSTAFFEASLLWRMHSTMPGGVYKVPLGDQSRVSDASLFSYDRPPALFMLPAAHASPMLTGQIYRWLNWIDQVPSREISGTATMADELLLYDPAVPAAPDLSGLPKEYLAPGAGFFIYRSSWTDPNATAMVFESGPVSGHGARDANGLIIWKGNFWVSANANIYSHSGVEGATENYNNLTVGTFGGQPLSGANSGKILTPLQVSDQLVVVRGQAANTYGYPPGGGSQPRYVSDYLRTVAYVPALDVFVVVDRVTITDGAQRKTWRWHSKGVPQIVGNGFRLEGPAGDFRCFGSVLAPSNVVLGTQAYSLGTGDALSSNAVTVSMTGSARDVVVTVLQCTGAQSAPYTPTATVSASEAVVIIAGRRVVVPLNESQLVRIE